MIGDQVPGIGRRSRAALVAVLAILAAAEAQAQQFVPTGRDTLRGLPGVEVVVEPLQPALEQVGLTAPSITASVSSQLRAAGIMLYASQRENPAASKPYVYVHVNAVALPRGGGYAVGIQVHLRQTLVSVVTESKVVNAMSWDAHNVLLISPTMVREETMREIRTLVDVFIEDWKSVH